ncbi:Oxidoreductase family, NAD-binding Rossmann fold [Ruminococcaceae bacterium FB2012]|nr:Oxidoreductase family, NAD-binding Rossmann fold [Ruminococcaceae bacterium FB2012]
MVRIGILCPSEIAYRRFLPAVKTVENVELIGVGVNSPEERYGALLPDASTIDAMLMSETSKAQKMISEYGGELFFGYEDIISSPKVDAVYIPLPPALHHKWAKKALEYRKHVLVEKPATISFNDTDDLVKIADTNKLALHENYMFMFHNQLDEIESVINRGEIGEVRLYRISFGFPRRDANDFRYNKGLGGGSLIDAGGYTIKYAARLLGETTEIRYAQLNYINDFDVDIYGSAALTNKDGVTAQIAFGMDNDYKCELEVWGSKGTIKTGRVLTAPAGFVPTMTIKKNTEVQEHSLPADDAFKKSIEHFIECINNSKTREDNYRSILRQANLVEQFKEMVIK